MSEATSSTRRAWTAVVFLAVGAGGAALQARGALVPSFATAFGISEGQLGLLTPVATLGFVGPVVVAGTLAGRIDLKRAFVVGIGLTGLTLALHGTATSYAVLLGFVALQSAAYGTFIGLDRPLLSHLYPERRGRILSLEGMAWATGATLGPLAVTLVLFLADWRWAYYVLGALFLPVALLAWRLDFPAGRVDERSLSLADVRPLLRTPAVLGMGVVLVLVGGIESTFFTWYPYYAGGFLPRSSANLALSVFLAAYVPGRLAFSAVADRSSPPTVILAVAGMLVVFLAVLFGEGPHPRLPFFGLTFLVGFLVSGLFPLTLTWGIEAEPTFTGPINAFAMVSEQVGFFVVPAVVGLLAERSSIGAAMRVQVALSVLLVALLVGRRLALAIRA